MSHPAPIVSGVSDPVRTQRFAVVDVETSGLSVRRHDVLQVGVVAVSYTHLTLPTKRIV